MAAQKKYPDELRERAVKMVLEIREREGKGHGELARVARQLGVHPEAPPRGPADFPAHRMRLAATPASRLCLFARYAPESPGRGRRPAVRTTGRGRTTRSPARASLLPGQSHRREYHVRPAERREHWTASRNGPETGCAATGLAPDLSPPSRRRTAAVMRARAAVDRYDALNKRQSWS